MRKVGLVSLELVYSEAVVVDVFGVLRLDGIELDGCLDRRVGVCVDRCVDR